MPLDKSFAALSDIRRYTPYTIKDRPGKESKERTGDIKDKLTSIAIGRRGQSTRSSSLVVESEQSQIKDIREYVRAHHPNYEVTGRLGSGAFGTVYQLQKVIESGTPAADAVASASTTTGTAGATPEDRQWPDKLALKVEKYAPHYRSLVSEAMILQQCQDATGFPKFYKYAEIHLKYNLCFMQFLGPSLDTLLEECGGTFSVKTTLLIAMQLLNRLQSLHTAGYLYRDLKPENCLLGPEGENRIYLIDFGLCQPYKLPDGHHVPFTTKNSFSGSMRYASMRQQRGDTPGRRDDLESLGFIMVYFLKGRLPWQRQVMNCPVPTFVRAPSSTTSAVDSGAPVAAAAAKAAATTPPPAALEPMTKDQLKANILKKKIHTPLKELCEGTPPCVLTYLTICRNMAYDEVPDYKKLRTILLTAFKSAGYALDHIYDWTPQHLGSGLSSVSI